MPSDHDGINPIVDDTGTLRGVNPSNVPFWRASAKSTAVPLTQEVWTQFLIDFAWRWHCELHPQLYPEYAPYVIVPPRVLAAARAAGTDVGVLPAHGSGPAAQQAAWAREAFDELADADELAGDVEPDAHDVTGST